MFPQIFGKYVLEREIAAGGMARVYLATLRGAVGFEKRLVVKQIRTELAQDEAFVARFVDEAKTAVELSHPNIVPVYELGVEQGIYYIAMELCAGTTLTELLQKTGPLGAAEGALVGVELCRALDYAHRRAGIVHRDVTPRNVLIDEEGAVRIIDFGIASPATGPDGAGVEVFGTPGHMPPEQVRGARLTPATDVFAIGALLWEAWTGRAPFRRATFRDSVRALEEPLPELAELAPDLAEVAPALRQALALDPDQRTPDAEALARPLRDFLKAHDTGEVARRLGARVRRALRGSERPTAEAPAPAGASPGGARTLPTAPLPETPRAPATSPGTPATRTFAAREEVVQWTRKLSSAPPPGSSELDGAAPPELPRRPEPRSGVRRFAWPALAVVAAVLVWAALREDRKPTAPAVAPASSAALRPPPAPQPTQPAQQTPVSLARALVSASSAPAPAPAPPPASSAVRATAMPSTSGPARTPERGAMGTLRLTADPPASVTVTGAAASRSLVTPVAALELPPGTYSVTFRSDTYAAPVVGRVEIGAGARRSVHADFRDAVPTLAVR